MKIPYLRETSLSFISTEGRAFKNDTTWNRNNLIGERRMGAGKVLPQDGMLVGSLGDQGLV